MIKVSDEHVIRHFAIDPSISALQLFQAMIRIPLYFLGHSDSRSFFST